MTTFHANTFDIYSSAYDHAQTKTRCAHVACGVLINGELTGIYTNTPDHHAEVEALASLEPDSCQQYCEKGFLPCERGV
jgi:hypothetical protein